MPKGASGTDWKPLTAAELKGPVTRSNFRRRAHHHGVHVLNLASDEWPTIAPGTVEWEAWKAYFQRKGWIPAQMARLEAAGTDDPPIQPMTVPTPYPDQFDPAGCEPESSCYGQVADRAYADHLGELDQEPEK